MSPCRVCGGDFLFPWKISRPGLEPWSLLGPPSRWNGREPWPARPGPHFLGRNGGKNPGGGGSSPRNPFSGGIMWGEAVPLTGYLACGPHIERPVTARPPAGRAGDVDRYPLGKGGEKPFFFLLFPPVNEPPLPPARAGGRAMRRWSWRPQARPYLTNHLPPFLPPENGVPKEGTSFPLVFFPLFLQRNRAPPGRAPFPPVPTAMEKAPTALCPQPREKTEERAAAPSPVSGSL